MMQSSMLAVNSSSLHVLPRTVPEYVEQDLVTVNFPDNDLLYSHMVSIGHYTDFVLESKE